MYYLRDRGDKNSLECLASLLHPKYREKTGVLFRHEICFVMGCLGENAICIVDKIIDCAKDITENGIVRHEAVSAYSSIYDDKDVLYTFYLENSF
jgi:deoxyhypusine monooxygenase